MSDFRITSAEHVASAGTGGGFPAPLYPEIAIVGRSNVGKSTLINTICNRSIAKTSKTPGKTRRIQYFLLNGTFYLVDLPGYGFARVSHEQQREWERSLTEYLSGGRVRHILLLLDSRHEPTALDRQMAQWIIYNAIPYTIIGTKVDKLPKSKQLQAVNALPKALGVPACVSVPFSSMNAEQKRPLLERLGALLDDFRA